MHLGRVFDCQLITDMSEPTFFADGLRFDCLRCGACCTGEEGYVFLTEEDVERLMKGLGLTRDELIERHLRIVDGKYSLQETEDGRCVFWAGDCKAYEHRPYQCMSYPFWPSIMRSKESWNQLATTCVGVGRGRVHTEEEIRGWLRGFPRKLIGITPLSGEK